MLRKTTKILAIAVTVAACGGTAGPDATDHPSKQELAGKSGEPGSPTSKGNPTPATPPAPTTGPTPAPAPAPAPAACDKNTLDVELSDQLLESALANHARYRCLCDDQGYPLVGNINGKGTTASAFCEALLEKGLL